VHIAIFWTLALLNLYLLVKQVGFAQVTIEFSCRIIGKVIAKLPNYFWQLAFL
jgi:hypothetical protein